MSHDYVKALLFIYTTIGDDVNCQVWGCLPFFKMRYAPLCDVYNEVQDIFENSMEWKQQVLPSYYSLIYIHIDMDFVVVVWNVTIPPSP